MYRRGIHFGRWAGLASAAAVLATTGTAQAPSIQALWSFPSDGSWQPETVALGADGSEVFSEYGSYLNERVLLSVHDSDPPTPVWSDGEQLWNHYRAVDSASQGSTHAALHQEYIDSTMTWRRPVLRKYSTGSDTPDWVYESSVLISSSSNADVRVSTDGSQVTAVVYDVSGGQTRLSVFDASSPTPTSEFSVDTGGAFEAFEVSGDGKVIALRSQLKLSVVDLESGAVRLSKYYFYSPFAGGLSLSGDGSVVAMATGSELQVFEWNGSAYGEPALATLPSGGYSPAVAVSGDGSRVAAGTNYYNQQGDFRVQCWDVEGLVNRLDHATSAPGTTPNVVSALRLSADGDTIAVGLWGDEGETVPELLVLSPDHPGDLASADLPGSVMDMDLSPDGRRVVVAAKGAHATDFGNGGGLYLFQVGDRDFRLHGAPQIGATVTFSQQHEAEAYGVVLSAPQLASEPQVFPGVGSLLLDAGSLSVLPSIVPTDGNGVAYVPHQIPNEASLVGTTSYYQGFGLRPRKLSEDFVRVTVLP